MGIKKSNLFSKGSTEVTVVVQAGTRTKIIRAIVDAEGTVGVWDNVTGGYKSSSWLSDADIEKIRRMRNLGR